MRGYAFSKYTPRELPEGNFDDLLKLFTELLNYTSGDAAEALAWMNELDKQHRITADDYGMGNFIEDLKKQGYLTEDNEGGEIRITPKTEQVIRRSALEEIFGKLRKSGKGQHTTKFSGQGDELNAERREYQFGDSAEQIDMTTSLHNAQINHGIGDFRLTERDLEVEEMDYKTITSTVLMIDISHSMILYGEDRITPAKKVAMALSELISTRYPKDTLDIVVFGNDAWPIQIKDLPYLQVGPYHTNTYAGLQLATDILRRRKTNNKQIFMITDGKPTCLKEGNRYYKNSFGLDRKVITKTLNMAAECKKLRVPITTFMIARDPYLQQFVREFTRTNGGKAFYSTLNGLGEYIFEDYIRNRRRTVR
ncbi:von Willebrand factor type A domain-containing protein [Anseongella ginsenosidimutans]|uniref:von Willebrand factor type A domain-containing protein n=1 Tax=Anseongella ginsenosidimutans TaxID=496056 RepID=A0A4R3KYC9_9SPHI|nr:VWA domain-containing protein [Anseongella ginsenosidimutans]QEC51275.1 VWA domain-containing protein [Anseongella ginsenosidimutans]TCS90036.1 von Willebrand factor type A domain-containing protein [Anseongella ginsenosidimutans]